MHAKDESMQCSPGSFVDRMDMSAFDENDVMCLGPSRCSSSIDNDNVLVLMGVFERELDGDIVE